jgi:hypothetical protein
MSSEDLLELIHKDPTVVLVIKDVPQLLIVEKVTETKRPPWYHEPRQLIIERKVEHIVEISKEEAEFVEHLMSWRDPDNRHTKNLFIYATLRIKTREDLRLVINWYIVNCKLNQRSFSYCLRDILTSVVGFALPSFKALHILNKWLNEINAKRPQSKIVNVGAGSCAWEFLLNRTDIVSVDRKKATHSFKKQFMPVIREEYTVHPDDVLMIMWGYGMSGIVDDYVRRGGWCVILIGESQCGCTDPSGDYFSTDGEFQALNWNIREEIVPGGASGGCTDIMSLNMKS